MLEEFRPRGRATIAKKWLNINKNDVILDIGCSQGYFERYYLIGKVKKVIGIDINKKSIDYAKKRDGSEYYLHQNAEDLPFQDDEFNKILLLDVLEHVDEENKILSEIYRVLKIGGILIISVPRDFFLSNILDIRNIKIKAKNDPYHKHYSLKYLKKKLHDLGFKIIKEHRTASLISYVTSIIFMYSPSSMRFYLRKALSFLEDFDYHLKLSRIGFCLMILAKK